MPKRLKLLSCNVHCVMWMDPPIVNGMTGKFSLFHVVLFGEITLMTTLLYGLVGGMLVVGWL